MTNLKFFIMMMIAVISWAFAFPLIKIGLNNGLSFINLTIMRFFFVTIGFILLLILQKNKFTKLQKQDIIPIFLLGFLGITIYHLGLNYGEQYISPGAASLIIATIPIQIIIFASIFLNEKITKKKILGIITALAGVTIISIWGSKNATIEINYITGAAAVVVAAIMGALYTIAGKKLLTKYNGLSLTTYAMLLNSICLIPLIRNSLFTQISQINHTTWLALIFLGFGSTVVGYVIWYVALETKTASEVSMYLYIIPVLSTIISYILFKDPITPLFIIGGILVITGLFIINTKNQTKIKQTIRGK